MAVEVRGGGTQVETMLSLAAVGGIVYLALSAFDVI